MLSIKPVIVGKYCPVRMSKPEEMRLSRSKGSMNNMCFNVLTGVAGPIYYFENDDAMYISELGRFEILTKRAQNDVVYTTYIRAPLKERQWAQNERMMMTYKTETEAKRGHNYYHTLAGVHGDNWSEYLPFSQDGGPVEIVEVTINTKTVNS